MENTFGELEASIEKTGGRLQNIASSLTECDHISETLEATQTESEVVEGLLRTVKQVQSHYETFREDLLELRELQKQIRIELRSSASELQRRVISLRLRMPENYLRESKNMSPQLMNEEI
ncbi:uncharacterized protein [Rhodnius prolixus]|uniref:uncharacterized protein n=1 Tax=Rhodnius prolixus TaxID=13249 RepID=UPI003D18BB51